MNEFIISVLKDITYIFEDIQCRYRYDSLCEANYVQILPLKAFKENKELKNYRGQILDKFYELFPNESLVFLTEGSSIQFKGSEFKVSGKYYTAQSTVKWIKYAMQQPSDNVLGIYNPMEIDGNYAYAA